MGDLGRVLSKEEIEEVRASITHISRIKHGKKDRLIDITADKTYTKRRKETVDKMS
jgi:hypothetical protein